MTNFDEYLRQGEPDKAEKAKVWKTAIGLQQVDGLTPSEYLIETAKQNIDGDITIEEVKQRIDTYYKQQSNETDAESTEEADKVSTRIVEILSEQTFTFSPVEFLFIHRRLFQDIYKFAGEIRDYNIIKKEWILDGETVLYGSAESLKETLEYDFKQERQFSYKGLSQQQTVEHIAQFISYLWQIHVFGEGNTRAVAIFLIKYLRTFGYTVNNNLFEQHSWYFRNALVRANYKDNTKDIHATPKFLIRFLENLLFEENHILKNREMHIHYEEIIQNESSEKGDGKFGEKQKSSEKIIVLIANNKHITIKELSEQLNLSTRAIEKNLAKLKVEGFIERIGADRGGHWKIIKE